jgi:hypothetical protein
MGGSIAGAIASQLFVSARFSGAAAQSEWNTQLISVTILIFVSAWHASLLFPGEKVRFWLWTALPSILLFFPFMLGLHTGFLLFPVLETALMANIRRRWGLWILAYYLGVPFVAIGSITIEATIGLPIATYLANQLTDTLGMPRGTMSGFIGAGDAFGPQVLCDALLAATLAWKMPPIKSEPKPTQTLAEADQPSAS